MIVSLVYSVHINIFDGRPYRYPSQNRQEMKTDIGMGPSEKSNSSTITIPTNRVQLTFDLTIAKKNRTKITRVSESNNTPTAGVSNSAKIFSK